MLLAYTLLPGFEFPELCIVPDKPDQFSAALRVETLIETRAAVMRLSSIEALTIAYDAQDGGMVLSSIGQVPLYITPNLTDRPGVAVAKLKVRKLSQDSYQTLYQRDRGGTLTEWQEWLPNEAKF